MAHTRQAACARASSRTAWRRAADACAGSPGRDDGAAVDTRARGAFVVAVVSARATGGHDYEDDREPRDWEEDDKHDERFGYLREA
jgi:hypothetical protein